MLVSKIKCLKCKGLGEYAGMGGIMRECGTCDGTGKIERDMPERVTETVSATEAFVSMGIPLGVVNQVIAPAVENTVSPGLIKETIAIEGIKQDNKPAPVARQEPAIDEVMQAVIDEPRMEALAWKNKYRHVKGLFAKSIITGQYEELITKVQRAAMRANYASNQVIAERVVDMGALQDATVINSPEYKAYAAQEKLRTEKIESKAKIQRAQKVRE